MEPEKKYVQAQIDKVLHRRLMIQCARQGLKIKEGVAKAIEQFCKNVENPKLENLLLAGEQK